MAIESADQRPILPEFGLMAGQYGVDFALDGPIPSFSGAPGREMALTGAIFWPARAQKGRNRCSHFNASPNLWFGTTLEPASTFTQRQLLPGRRASLALSECRCWGLQVEPNREIWTFFHEKCARYIFFVYFCRHIFFSSAGFPANVQAQSRFGLEMTLYAARMRKTVWAEVIKKNCLDTKISISHYLFKEKWYLYLH